jgi:hypothetical protein
MPQPVWEFPSTLYGPPLVACFSHNLALLKGSTTASPNNKLFHKRSPQQQLGPRDFRSCKSAQDKSNQCTTKGSASTLACWFVVCWSPGVCIFQLHLGRLWCSVTTTAYLIHQLHLCCGGPVQTARSDAGVNNFDIALCHALFSDSNGEQQSCSVQSCLRAWCHHS